MRKKNIIGNIHEDVKDLDLGGKIRDLRKTDGMTLKTIAAMTRLSVPLLSQIENDLVIPPISTLLKISKALNKDISFFFTNSALDAKVAVVRASERIRLDKKSLRKERTADSYETLAHKKTRKHMEPFLIELETARRKSTQLVRHKGEEFIFVLEGTIEFITKDNVYVLEVGDAVYFESDVPHASRSIGKKIGKALLVIFST